MMLPQALMGLMNQNMVGGAPTVPAGARVKPRHGGEPVARDSITDSTFQQFGTPTSYAGVARSGLAATPWVQELAQMGLQRAGDLGQYAAAGPAQLQALQAEAAANTGARGGLQQIEQAGLGGLRSIQGLMGQGPSTYEQSGGAGVNQIRSLMGAGPSAYEQAGQGQIGTMAGIAGRTGGALNQLGGVAASGQDALAQQRALGGFGGVDAQNAAIAQVQNSPQMQALQKAQETALLQNAAATGGLRGGNTQRALADSRAQLLAQQLDAQYGRAAQMAGQGAQAAGQIAGMGQSAAGGLLSGGMGELSRRQAMQAGLGQTLAGMGQSDLARRQQMQAGLGQGLAGMAQGSLGNRYSTGLGLRQGLMGQGLQTSQYMTGLGGNLAQTLMGSGQNAIGNIAQIGANAAAQQGTQAMQSGANIANIMQQGGQGAANAALARGAAQAGMWNNLGNTAGTMMGMYNSGMFGGQQPQIGAQTANPNFAGGGFLDGAARYNP